jgi:superfamily II DNA or RNA helicase
VFAVNIDHVLALTNAFRTELGVEAAFVHEGIRQSDREILYERFRSGEIRVLVNCGEFRIELRAFCNL